MISLKRPILFDVTRLISTGWMNRHSTGIDRVCDAYMSHYRDQAHAVIQHKGVFRILSERHSDKLFTLLSNRGKGFRYKLTNLMPGIMAANSAIVSGEGRKYLNVGHTDFDLQSHQEWVERCDLKSIYMIHDLIPINGQAYCRPHAIKRHRGRVISSLNNAAGIIVNSNATAAALSHFAISKGLKMPPILAAHLGVQDVGSSADMSVSPKEHFVCIGTIEPRKNHLMLLRVWQKLISETSGNIPQLLIIGRWGKQSKPVRDLLSSDPILAKHVTMLNKCSDADMLELTKSAKAVLLPTLAEGYGLPLIEAMTMNVPVIASDLPCFREIGAGIPLLLSPKDEAGWKDAIINFLMHNEESKRQKRQMKSYTPPSWREHFAKVNLWLEDLNGENLYKVEQQSVVSSYRENSKNLILEKNRHADRLPDRKVPSL